MKSSKNIVMLIVLCVVVLLAVIAVFFVNKNSVNNCIKDEKVQVETLKEIYKDMFSNLNTQDVNIVLDETALKNICVFVALNDLSNVIYPLLVDTKPLYILMIVIKTLINKAINTIEFVLAPTQIIINGPRATLGSEFKIVRYGSTIFEMILLLQSTIAVIKPITVAIKKLKSTSHTVTQI